MSPSVVPIAAGKQNKRHRKRPSSSGQAKPGSPKKGSPRKVKKTLKLTEVEAEKEMNLVHSAGPRQRSGKLDALHSVMKTKNIKGHGARDVANIVRLDLSHKEHALHTQMVR